MKGNKFRIVILLGVLFSVLAVQLFIREVDANTVTMGGYETRGTCELKDGKVLFDFELVNHYTESKKLQFNSGQQFELTITNKDGEEVYKYSDGKFFISVIVYKNINPGESIRWQDEWDMTDKDGENLTTGKYNAEIRILAMPEEQNKSVEEIQLTTDIEFDLTELRYKRIEEIATPFMVEGTELVVPKESDQAEPFAGIDLNKDCIDEIAVFYKQDTEVGMILLERNDHQWVLVEKIVGYGEELDYANFCDLDGDEQPEILIGGEDANRDKKLIVYKWNGKKYRDIAEIDYASFSVGDLEGNGTNQIASIISTDKQIPTVKLQVYSFIDDSYKQEYEMEFQYGEYPDVVTIGNVKENQKGIVVDMGLGAHSAVTQIIIKEDGKYKKVLTSENEYNFLETFKPYPLFSKDINNDGIIEIGIQTAPPETDHLPMAGIPWVNNWYQWDGEDGLTKIIEEYSNHTEGYQLCIPKSWQGKYTIAEDIDENFVVRSVDFIYLAANGEKAQLITLHHIPKPDWAERKQEFKNSNQSYIVLGYNKTNMLVAELFKDNDMICADSIDEYNNMISDKASILGNFNPIANDTEIIIDQKGSLKPEIAKKVIEETANKIINAISIKDSKTISDFVHPNKGLRFTPYTNVSLEQDVAFNKEEIETFFENGRKYLWGYYDGIGDKIFLTPSEYYEDFIYSEDFVNADQIGYNEVLSSGNMIENQFEVYENPIVVEYYFPGFNPDYAGMDWKSLRLVFEQYRGEWKLVGIIHNQWTI